MFGGADVRWTDGRRMFGSSRSNTEKELTTPSFQCLNVLQENKARYLTERGQNVNGQPNVIYLSIDSGSTWQPLHEFVDKENNLTFCAEEVMFFEHQLDLFGKLAYVSPCAKT